MADAGFVRGSDGFYAGPGGERLAPELRTEDRADRVAPMTALASGWRTAGFDFSEFVVPAAQTQDNQVKSSYPGVLMSATAGREGAFNSMGTNNVSRPENQWRGSAWDGYSNPELDRLITAFGVALEPADRARLAGEIVKLYTTELPAISLFFPVTPLVFTSDLTGPNLRPAESSPAWNIHEWELH
jgi:peptide/nickel transport system substrate-binding protein